MTDNIRHLKTSQGLNGHAPYAPLDGPWILVKSDPKIQETLVFKSLESDNPLRRETPQSEREAETMATSPLLKIPAVAGLLSMSKSKVHELVRTGDIPSVRIDRCVRVRQSDLEAFIERRMVGRPISHGSGTNG